MSESRTCPNCSKPLPVSLSAAECPVCLLRLAASEFADEDGSARAAGLGGQDPSTSVNRIQIRQIGDYELLQEIGRGGMGVVFMARQRSLNRSVALKVLAAGQLASEAQIVRFHKEAEAAAALDHPNIVPIFETGEHEGWHYFTMGLVEGGNLNALLPQLKKDHRAGIALLAKVARAVHHAHQRGILDRDLKPSNILIGADGMPHVSDFGLAKVLNQPGELTRSQSLLGSPQYMSPEQARGDRHAISSASDIYSLGVILYQILTGRLPFVGESEIALLRQIIDAEPVPPRKVNPRVALHHELICLKCLSKEPRQRYATASELAEDLERAWEGKPVQAQLGSQAKGWRQLVQRAWSGMAIGVATVSLGVLVFLQMDRPNSQPLPEQERKLAPYSAVRWNKAEPEVFTGTNWHRLLSVSDIPTETLVSIARQKTPDWQEHFEQELVELLRALGRRPRSTVTLRVQDSSGAVQTLADLPLTRQNWDALWWMRQRERTVHGVATNGLTWHVRVPKSYDRLKTTPAIILLHDRFKQADELIGPMANNDPETAESHILIGIDGDETFRPDARGQSSMRMYRYRNFVGRASPREGLSAPARERRLSTPAKAAPSGTETTKVSTLPDVFGPPRDKPENPLVRDGRGDQGPALIVEAINELKRTLNFDAPILIGVAHGAWSAYSLFMNYPEHFSGLLPAFGGLTPLTEPSSFLDPQLRAEQRRRPIAVVPSPAYAQAMHYDLLVDDGFPLAVRFDPFEQPTAAQSSQLNGQPALFAVDLTMQHRGVPVPRAALNWLRQMTSTNAEALLRFAEESADKGAWRRAAAALVRVEHLSSTAEDVRRVQRVRAVLDQQAAAAAPRVAAQLRVPDHDAWRLEFGLFREQFETAPSAADVLATYHQSRDQQGRPPETALRRADDLLERGDWEGGRAKLREILSDHSAAAPYWRIKHTLTHADLAAQIRRDLPVRAPGTPSQALDISAFFNRSGLREFPGLPEGVHSLAGTQFDLRARLDLRGAIFEETGSMLPRAARGIRVGRGFRRLQALHAASWWDTDGAVIGAYVLKYADGAIAELPIVYGRHLRGWVGNVHEPMQATEAVLAWTGSHSSFASPVRLFKAAYENPRPDLPVESIDVVSNMAWAAPMVVALTVDP